MTLRHCSSHPPSHVLPSLIPAQPLRGHQHHWSHWEDHQHDGRAIHQWQITKCVVAAITTLITTAAVTTASTTAIIVVVVVAIIVVLAVVDVVIAVATAIATTTATTAVFSTTTFN
jgi:hypothetical protein